MLGTNDDFRPWGNFHEIMQSQRGQNWALIACAAVEPRSTAVFTSLVDLAITGPQLVFEIEDPISISTAEIQRRTQENKEFIQGLGFHDQTIAEVGLTSPFGKFETELRNFLDRIDQANLIIDITSLPKKVYFFLTKLLFQLEAGPRNVVFTYAEPSIYSTEPLAANPDPWEALPGFRVSALDQAERSIVVGIGYEPLGLPELVESGRFDENQITFLFPFPAQADRVARNWRFIRGIFPNPDRLEIKRVDGINVPEVFQTLTGLGEGGDIGLTLAPFGPKTMSLAMAIYASKTSTSATPTGVYYTQPTYYNPDYSTGIKTVNGRAVLNTYCLKLGGQMLY